ncbi:AAA family ATPase [Pseudonocardia sp. RS010]|uniref:AAA family ATPase n=1 Tax=Pseudonocardia sp. RS010 TaxID=3385979 RepID=UPI0039A1835D
MSVRHFLDIDGAATLPTEQLALVDQAVADLVGTRAMGAVHGPAGLGKTFAVEQALDRRTDEASACWVSFPSRPTMRLVAATLYGELCGASPGRRDRFALTAELLEQLADHRGRDGRERLVVVDEAQQLNRECIEFLRYLHDHRLTRFGLLLVGGDGAWRVLAREPMLRSRIYRRVVCTPLSGEQVCALLPRYHRIYADLAPELLLFVDDHFAHGYLRDWAAFTATAVELCQASGADRLDEQIARNAFALQGGVRSRPAATSAR